MPPHELVLTEPSERGSRERSPVPTRNQREAPPQVRPETQAHLAESLATHLQKARKDPVKRDDLQAQAQAEAEMDASSVSTRRKDKKESNPPEKGAMLVKAVAEIFNFNALVTNILNID